MRKPFLLVASLIVPALLIIAGFYYKMDLLTSIGSVILIFIVIMLVRGKITGDKKNEA